MQCVGRMSTQCFCCWSEPLSSHPADCAMSPQQQKLLLFLAHGSAVPGAECHGSMPGPARWRCPAPVCWGVGWGRGFIVPVSSSFLGVASHCLPTVMTGTSFFQGEYEAALTIYDEHVSLRFPSVQFIATVGLSVPNRSVSPSAWSQPEATAGARTRFLRQTSRGEFVPEVAV